MLIALSTSVCDLNLVRASAMVLASLVPSVSEKLMAEAEGRSVPIIALGGHAALQRALAKGYTNVNHSAPCWLSDALYALNVSSREFEQDASLKSMDWYGETNCLEPRENRHSQEFF